MKKHTLLMIRILPLLRAILILCVCLAALGALTTSYFKVFKIIEHEMGPILMGEEGPSTGDKGTDFQRAIRHWSLLAPLLVFLLHFCYLFLVVRDLVFLNPVDSSERFHTVLPFFLCGVYILGAVDGFTGFQITHWGPLLFAFVYFLWAVMDFSKLKTKPANSGRPRTRHLTWFFIDLASLIILVAVFCFSWWHEWILGSFLGVGVKEGVVALSIAGWVMTWCLLRTENKDNFASHYKNYLDSVLEKPGKIQLADGAAALKISMSAEKVRVFDFESANSERSVQVLEEILKIDRSRIDLSRFDRYNYWCDLTPKGISPTHFSNDLDEVLKEPDFDLIVGSHVFYKPDMVESFIDATGRCLDPKRIGAGGNTQRVVVRGYGPNSFYSTLLMEASMGQFPNFAHLWNTEHLEKLVKNCELENVVLSPTGSPKDPVGPPYAIIRQEMTIHEHNIREIHTVLQVLYGVVQAEVMREILQRMLDQLHSTGIPSVIANDDLVYVFRPVDDSS